MFLRRCIIFKHLANLIKDNRNIRLNLHLDCGFERESRMVLPCRLVAVRITVGYCYKKSKIASKNRHKDLNTFTLCNLS